MKPHFHAIYAGQEVQVAIAPLQRLRRITIRRKRITVRRGFCRAEIRFSS